MLTGLITNSVLFICHTYGRIIEQEHKLPKLRAVHNFKTFKSWSYGLWHRAV